MVETINKVKKANSQLLHQNGREATPDEIAEYLEMPVDKVSRDFESCARACIT